MTHKWVKLEAGWYHLEGTVYTICNMRGQSVRYSGACATWEIRIGRASNPRGGARPVQTCWSMRDAKRVAEKLAENA